MTTCCIVLSSALSPTCYRAWSTPLISAHTVYFHMSLDLITRGKKINWLNVFWTPFLSYHSFVCKDGKLASSRMPPKEFPSVPSGYRSWWINLSWVRSVINGLWWRNIPTGEQSSLVQLNSIKCPLKSITHANAHHCFIMPQGFPGYYKFWGSLPKYFLTTRQCQICQWVQNAWETINAFMKISFLKNNQWEKKIYTHTHTYTHFPHPAV